MTANELVEKFPLLSRQVKDGQFDHHGINIIGHGDKRYVFEVGSLEDLNQAMQEVLENKGIARAWIQNERYHATSPARLIKFK